jgi:hypothetical protein
VHFAVNNPRFFSKITHYTGQLSTLSGLTSQKTTQIEGYGLDLSFADERIITMGYLDSGFEWLFRNKFEYFNAFLQELHGTAYWFYNLRSERNYKPEKLKSQMSRFPFEDSHRLYLIRFALQSSICKPSKSSLDSSVVWQSLNISNTRS